MNYLLDTQVLLWLFLRSKRLPKPVLEQLLDLAHVLYVSAASTWEIAIKAGIGKLALPGEPAAYLPDRIARAGLTTLPILPATRTEFSGSPPS